MSPLSSLRLAFPLLLVAGCGSAPTIPEESLEGDGAAFDSSSFETGGGTDTAVAVDSSTVEDTNVVVTDTAVGVDTAVTSDTAVVTDTAVTCAAVTDNKFYVDPSAGNDTTGTGTTACPFKTIGRTIGFLNSTFTGGIPAGAQVLLRGNASAATGETFPLSVPANVTIRSELTTSVRTVEVAAGKTGFNLSRPNSGLASLIIDGKGAAYAGIGVGGSASSTTTTLGFVTVTSMRNDGIYVESGGVRIGAGVRSILNGTSPTSTGLGSGLHVRGGSAVIVVAAGEAATGFDQNAANGIIVDGTGYVTATGKADLTGYPSVAPPAVTSGTGTITVKQNKLAGIGIVQTSAASSSNVLTGVVVWKNEGNGIRVYAQSRLILRDSVSVANGRNGVEISPTSASTSVANIDLGGDGFGKNLLQWSGSGLSNLYAGICVDNFYGNAVTVLAKGNYFGAKSCALSLPPTLPVLTSGAGNADCSGIGSPVDIAAEKGSGGSTPTKVTVSLASCADVVWP